MIRIKTLRQLSWIFPSQWEARTTDDQPVYVRYKHGELHVHVGRTGGSTDDAIAANPIFDEDVGEECGCMLEWHEVVEATGITVVDA